MQRHLETSQQEAQPLAVMDRQLSHMTLLVDQLMDAARISSGKIVLDWKELDLGELVRAVIEDHAALFATSRLKLESSLPERPLVVVGDRLRLAQALGNLLTNAAKFTPRGTKPADVDQLRRLIDEFPRHRSRS
jgi:signal transduction histidine kinase